MPVPGRSLTQSQLIRRAASAVLRRGGSGAAGDGVAVQDFDSWLSHYHGERLAELDRACAASPEPPLSLFAELDADLWALLLTQRYELYPHIRAALPDVPDPALQELWTGTSGATLAAQSVTFYRRLVTRYAEAGEKPLRDSAVLDFGCGWGRLTRFLARDVEPGRLFGCDPVAEILDVCRDTRVPAVLARSEFLPERLPFDQQFDLAFSFSVFTHLAEPAHLACLQALNRGLRPGGILVLTIRPPHYLELSPLMQSLRESLGEESDRALEQPRYLFAPHPTAPLQPPGAGESTYGEAVITMAYVRERWAELFELLEVDLLLSDLHQVMLTLRRRPA